MKNKSVFGLLFGFVGVMAMASFVEAQAIKPWGAISPAQRFEILTSYNNEAVLDRETGLVWQRTPITNNNQPGTFDRSNAILACLTLSINGHAGWRLPKVEELISLEDPTVTSSPDGTRLPTGHPFLNVIVTGEARAYWSSAVDAKTGSTYGVAMSISGSNNGLIIESSNSAGGAWCVRGGAN